ncbi:MarR family winged helix-turn-helix transcriptional regulator [Frankia sp. QA3]|uniref:MarR family winged helix-turn-helix transcriptional regulator n=1 Tax=Frankia sp. QA3 TaxID=710111 RepID=UPI000269C4BF|nr:MarR family transcriptional regulator [Frankia sp. QA3]EIV94819.1 transcriptional regulator [Frankia sp. QA3]
MQRDPMADDDSGSPGTSVPGRPTAQELDVLKHVPLLAAYFQRARTEMPPELRGIFDAHGLTARHGAVLTQLLTGKPASVTELAARLGVSLSTASQLVGNLSDAGVVERREDPSNRRRTLVSLREQHRPAVESFVATRSAPLLRAMAGLSARDRAGFVAGLAAWIGEVQP